MEAEISGSSRREAEKELKLKKETLQSLVEQCQRALESIRSADGGDDSYESDNGEDSASVSSSQGSDSETAELCDLLKSRVESPNFLEKLGSIHMSVPNNMNEEGSSWDMVSETDLWEGYIDGDNESDQDGYVLVGQEDIVDGIACFMAAYLLSLKQSKLLAKLSLRKRKGESFERHGMEAKLFTMWPLGVPLQSGYTRTQHCSRQHLWPSGHLVMLYPNSCDFLQCCSWERSLHGNLVLFGSWKLSWDPQMCNIILRGVIVLTD